MKTHTEILIELDFLQEKFDNLILFIKDMQDLEFTSAATEGLEEANEISTQINTLLWVLGVNQANKTKSDKKSI